MFKKIYVFHCNFYEEILIEKVSLKCVIFSSNSFSDLTLHVILNRTFGPQNAVFSSFLSHMKIFVLNISWGWDIKFPNMEYRAGSCSLFMHTIFVEIILTKVSNVQINFILLMNFKWAHQVYGWHLQASTIVYFTLS